MCLCLLYSWIPTCTKGLPWAKAVSINKFSFGSENGEVCGHFYLDQVPTRSLFPTLISCLLLMNISLFSSWSQIAKQGLMHQLCHYGSEFCLLSSLANSFHPMLTSYKPRGFLGSEMLGLLVPTQTMPAFINSIGMPPAHSMPPLYYFFWFSYLPKCSDNPALVVLDSLPYTSPFLHSTASLAKGMRNLNKEMSGKPSKGMLLSCCWLRWDALREDTRQNVQMLLCGQTPGAAQSLPILSSYLA